MVEFETISDLQSSQTIPSVVSTGDQFETISDLQSSQTRNRTSALECWFETISDLQSSQTLAAQISRNRCLRLFLIYKALKLLLSIFGIYKV